ncbi:MAG: DUF86 domain-containing protein [Opitutales bacterium]|nr:DUF86 domain-containing protein [Opitutales bacterium]
MHEVAQRRCGVPQSSRDAFSLLHKEGCLSLESLCAMQAMVGFRNLAVHDYQPIQLPILRSILEKRLGDFEQFLSELGSAGTR